MRDLSLKEIMASEQKLREAFIAFRQRAATILCEARGHEGCRPCHFCLNVTLYEAAIAAPAVGQAELSEEQLSEEQLSDLVSKCIQVIEQRNSWKSEEMVFFELAPNIATSGDIIKIGKVREWRATLGYGKNLDEIDHSNNYFGVTPEEAVSKALNALLRYGVVGKGPKHAQGMDGCG